MSISRYVAELRQAVGSRLLLLPGASALVRDAAGGLLFQRRSDDGRWSLPAGALDPGETPAEAAEREVREETGLVVRATEVAAVFGGRANRHTYPNGDEAEYLEIVFECEVLGGALRGRDDESVELRYWPAEVAPTLGLPYPPELYTWRRGDAPLFTRSC